MAFAVVAPYSGYLNSHHHWWPVTSMFNDPGAACACVMKIVLTVGTAMNTRITAGISVQAISSLVLPWVCGGVPWFSLRRYLHTIKTRTHSTRMQTIVPR